MRAVRARVIGDRGAGADDDRVGLRAATVHVESGGGARDPLARPVGCGGAAVEALRPLDGDVRAAECTRGEPGIEQGASLVAEHTVLDIDAGGAERGGAASGVLARIRDGEHDAGDAGIEQRLGAGAGAARVVARLERDDGGRADGGSAELRQCVDLRVRGAGTAMPALGERAAICGDNDGARLGVEGAGAAQSDLQGMRHGALGSVWLGGFARGCVHWHLDLGGVESDVRGARRQRVLPPIPTVRSAQEFHLPGQLALVCGL